MFVVVGIFLSSVTVFAIPPNVLIDVSKISQSQGEFAGELDASDAFGAAICSLGDLDGDGVSDLAIGAPGDDDRPTPAAGSDRGAVWIVFMNAEGTVKSSTKISDTSGGFGGGLLDGDRFGSAVTRIGDLDGDTVTELAVGTPGADDGGSGRGAVWVLFLNDNGTVKSQQKISATNGGFAGALDEDDQFGASVALLGDLGGDTVPELAVGAPYDDDGGADRGAVWILHLTAAGTVTAHQKISYTAGGLEPLGPGSLPGSIDDEDWFGSAVCGLDDLNGDGIVDLAVGAPGDDSMDYPTIITNTGAVWVLFLREDGTVKAYQRIGLDHGMLPGASLVSHDRFGSSIGLPGAIGADGIAELFVGATGGHGAGTRRGVVWALQLAENGKVRQSGKISDLLALLGGELNDYDKFGAAVAPAGDLDGDGRLDLAVGASADDDVDADAGAAWLLSLERDEASTVGTCLLFSPAGPLNTNAGIDGFADDGFFWGGDLTSDGSGNWVAVWETTSPGFGGGIGDDFDIVAARSDDNGLTWSDPIVVNSDAAVDGAKSDLSPMIATDGDGVWIVVAHGWFSRSTDNGQTWSTMQNLISAPGYSTTALAGDIASDGLGNWVVLWTTTDSALDATPTMPKIGAATSTDDGLTWSTPITLNHEPGTTINTVARPTLDTDGGGLWIASWVYTDKVAFARSTDNGLTWSSQQLIESQPGYWPSIKSDGNGTWGCVMSPGDSTFFIKSTDGGTTWSTPQLICNEGVIPRLTTDGAGRWTAVCERNAEIVYMISNSNGDTWTEPRLVNDNTLFSDGLDERPHVEYGQGRWIVTWQSNDSVINGEVTNFDHEILFAFTDTITSEPLMSLTQGVSPITNGGGPIDFGTATISHGRPSLTFTVANSGNRPLGIHGLTIPTQYRVIDPLDGCIPAGGSDDFTLELLDLTPGTFNGDVGFATDALKALEFSFSVTGQILAPEIDLFDDATPLLSGQGVIDFGIVDVGTTPPTATITVQNNGAGQLSISQLDLPNDYQLTEGLDTTIPPGGDDTFAVELDTGSAGGFAGDLVIHSNDQNEAAYRVRLSGLVQDPPDDVTFVWDAPASIHSRASLGSETYPDDEPFITTDGLGNWHVGWQTGFPGIIPFENLYVDFDMVYCRSSDHGQNWSAPAAYHFASADGIGNHDLNLMVRQNGAGVWMAIWETSNDTVISGIGSDNDMVSVVSTDAGLTWSDPVAVNSDAFTDDSLQSDQNVCLEFGNGVWVAMWRSAKQVHTAYSTDNGANWSTKTVISTRSYTTLFSRPWVATDGAGNWIVVWETDYPIIAGTNTYGFDSDLAYAVSMDNGQTWSTEAPLNDNAATDSGGDHHPVLATDGNGVWTVTWESTESAIGGGIGGDSDILFSRSLDLGANWSAPSPLNTIAATDAGADRELSVVVDEAGRWVAAWSSTESTIDGGIGSDFDIVMAVSQDSGLTWTTPTAVNTNAATDSGADEQPSLATDDAGRWLIAWRSKEDNIGAGMGTDADIVVSAGLAVPPAPEISLSRDGLEIQNGDGPVSFGSVPQYDSASSSTFIIANTGDASLLISGLSVPDGFSVLTSPPASIDSGTTASFALALTTDVAGSFPGSVSFTCNDTDENPFSFTVTGDVTAPELSVEFDGQVVANGDGPFDFGSTEVGEASLQKTWTVRNDGTADLTLSNLSAEAPFSIAVGLTGVLAPGTSDTVTIELPTTTPGVHNATISFESNDGDENPMSLTLTGTILTPEVSVWLDATPIVDEVSSLALADALRNAAPSSISLTIRNDGTSTLTLGNLSADPPFTASGTLTALLAPGDSTAFAVRLPTAAAGTFAGEVSFENSDADENPFSFSVTGDVLAPELTVEVNGQTLGNGGGPIDLGVAQLGDSALQKTFTVRNEGTADLGLSNLAVAMPFEISEGLTGVLSPGTSDTFTIQLPTTTTGDFNATVSFENTDDDESPMTFTVTGSVQAPEVTVLSGQTLLIDGFSSITLPAAVQDSTPSSATFIVRNDGTSTLSIANLQVDAPFEIVGVIASQLAPSTSDTFTIQLPTTSTGEFSGSLSFECNDADESPFNLSISGTVSAPIEPEVHVLDGAAAVADGGGPVDFGTATQGDLPLGKTFTVENNGTAELNTSGLSVPSGYTVTEGLSPSIDAGNADTFTVQLSTIAIGVFAGTISFENNDADENPYAWTVTGQITPPDPLLVWVQFDHAGVELGTQAAPFNTLAEGVSAVDAGGTVRIQTGASGETPRITKALRLEANGGAVRIGAAPPAHSPSLVDPLPTAADRSATGLGWLLFE